MHQIVIIGSIESAPSARSAFTGEVFALGSRSNYKHQCKFFSSLLAGTSKYKEPTHKNGKKQRASKKGLGSELTFQDSVEPLASETFHATHHVSQGASVMFLDSSSNFSSPKNISFEAVLGCSPKERHFLFLFSPSRTYPNCFLKLSELGNILF